MVDTNFSAAVTVLLAAEAKSAAVGIPRGAQVLVNLDCLDASDPSAIYAVADGLGFDFRRGVQCSGAVIIGKVECCSMPAKLEVV